MVDNKLFGNSLTSSFYLCYHILYIAELGTHGDSNTSSTIERELEELFKAEKMKPWAGFGPAISTLPRWRITTMLPRRQEKLWEFAFNK
jgi:hypothetical protein